MIEQYFIKREIMNLLLAYQNELLALVAIIVVFFIYLIVKKKTTPNNNDKEHEAKRAQEAPSITPDLIQQERSTEKEEERTLELDGTQEGEFIIEELTPLQKETQERKQIRKRDVPPHDKITKNNFKEFAGERILIAEDNIINQKVILGLLAESGIQVTVANDGVEALEILEKDNNFTLILMDAHMPRMDGFEATRKIRENPKYDHIVVIALSGDTAADDVRKMTEAGMAEHLEKPLKIDALYDILYAYSQQADQIQTQTFKELDTEEGLEIAGNDETFYIEILTEFFNTYAKAYQVIEKKLKRNEIDAVDKLLLDIIGVSANIGAKKLNKTAQELKVTLSSNDNKRSRILFQFKENLENLLKEIRNYLS